MIWAKSVAAALGAALMVSLAAPVPMARADSISSVEGARMKERQGRYLNRQDREQLRRYGGNDDYYRGPRYYGGYYDGPGIGIYVGPRRYYDPYGY